MSDPRDLQHDFYDMLMESQYWSPEDMLDYQRGELEQLLRHARANVPFYEHRLDCVFARDGSIDWDRWHEIPIVRRADMRDHRDQMLARELPVGHGQASTIHTSGSSGVSIAITSNRLVAIAANANRWRAHRWHEFDWSRNYAARLDYPNSDWPHGSPAGPWGPPWDASARHGQAIRIARSASPEQLLEFLNRTQSAYFSTGPKIAHSMALESGRLGIATRLDGFLAHGERVEEADRAIVRRVFGAPTLEHYSSKEGGQMAYSCPEGKGLHISAESVFLELVDEDNKPVAPGRAGRVVVTPFVSTAQPLIRYDQGDIATAGQPCSCGRGLPVLAEVHGRTTAIFTHPDGSTRSGGIYGDHQVGLGCTFWQIAQVGPKDFEVRYVPIDWDVPGNEEAFTAVFHQRYFPDARVRYVRLRDIPLTPAGKFIEYINEWAMARDAQR